MHRSRYDISGDEGGILKALLSNKDRTHTMAGRYGCLKEFLPDEDSIQAYLEVATLYFAANDID